MDYYIFAIPCPVSFFSIVQNAISYHTSNSPVTFTSSGLFMASQGSVFSEPVIEVTLTGDAEITIGGYMFELLGLTGKVMIIC